MSTTERDLYNGQSLGRYWIEQLDHAKGSFDTWTKRADKVVARYRDERAIGDTKSKFNILWSNVEVLTPSLYGRAAKPEVSRRHMDADPVGRLASTILERVLVYETEEFPDFDAAMEGSVEDRLLPGRGTTWIRLVEMDEYAVGDEAYSPADYVYWKDFLHAPARVWDEVWWVARAVYMTKSEVIDRFGEAFSDVPLLDEKPQASERKPEKTIDTPSERQAKIWEIWDKRRKQVCWIAEGYPDHLDSQPDPLELEGFFPCPKPLLATTTTGTLIPVPDYCEYQDQAEELDRLTGRIQKIVAAIKAMGVCNGEFKELTRLLQEGTDNKIIPISQWGAFSEKQGLKGALEMLDLTTQLQALGALVQAREVTKQIIYEICGISDIVRGQSKAEETLGAQQYKVQFGSLRLRSSQKDVARYAADIFKLKAQLICRFYPEPLLVQMSGILETAEGRDMQKVMAALQMLKNSTVRDFRIKVESDSLAQIDDAEEKAAAAEAITAIGGFVKEAVPMVSQAPETLPMVSEMLLFLVRRFKAGRALEAAIEQAMAALSQKAAQAAQNPQPSEAEIEARAQQQSDQIRAQVETQAHQMKAQMDAQKEQGKLQAEMQLEQMKMLFDKERESNEARLKLVETRFEQQMENYRAELEARTKLQIAGIQAQTQRITAEKQAEAAATRPEPRP